MNKEILKEKIQEANLGRLLDSSREAIRTLTDDFDETLVRLLLVRAKELEKETDDPWGECREVRPTEAVWKKIKWACWHKPAYFNDIDPSDPLPLPDRADGKEEDSCPAAGHRAAEAVIVGPCLGKDGAALPSRKDKALVRTMVEKTKRVFLTQLDYVNAVAMLLNVVDCPDEAEELYAFIEDRQTVRVNNTYNFSAGAQNVEHLTHQHNRYGRQ